MARVRIRKRNQRKTTISTSAAVDATSDLLALKAPQLSSITTTITSSNAGDKLLNLPANAASITASKEQPPVKRKRRRIRKRKSASSKKTTETDSKEENSKEEEEEEVEDEQAAVISQSATPTAAVVATLSIPNEKQIKTHDDESQAIQVLGSSPSAATTSDIIDAEKLKSLGIITCYEDIPSTLQKYWAQRYSLFSKFDLGIHMDHESWYSVTPEKIAQHIAKRCSPDDVVIDAFCGSGGNAIQFALHARKVIAIDIDPIKIACAKHNAALYGVSDRIEFMLGDTMTLLPAIATAHEISVIFLSPPWGGPEYLNLDVFDISSMTPDGISLYKTARTITPNIIYFLPRNTDPNQLTALAALPIATTSTPTSSTTSHDGICEVEATYLNDRQKCITAYYGNLAYDDGGGGDLEGHQGEDIERGGW